MTGQPKYCIDTNSLMDCRLRYYPPDVFETVWERMERLFEEGTLISHEEVLREITRKSDELAAWAKERSDYFVPFNAEQELVLIDILDRFERLVMTGKRKNAADPFLIALASTTNTILITQEKSGSQNKPKIPDVCAAFGVMPMPLLDMFRREGFRF